MNLKNIIFESCVNFCGGMCMYMAEWLTPWTPDLEVQGLSLTHRLVSLNKELLLLHFVSLHPGV